MVEREIFNLRISYGTIYMSTREVYEYYQKYQFLKDDMIKPLNESYISELTDNEGTFVAALQIDNISGNLFICSNTCIL